MTTHSTDDKDSAFAIAQRYDYGWNVRKNPRTAFKNYLKAANMGNVQAAHCVAVCYQNGLGVRKNVRRAMHWYSIAVRHSFLESEYNLGTLLATSKSNKYVHKGLGLLKKAATRGDLRATFNIGVYYDSLYRSGKTAARRRAIEWYKRAAVSDKQAQFNLGLLYESSARPSFPQASSWYRKAAKQGHAAAACNLAVLLLVHRGTRSKGEAVKWMRYAAEHGDAKAKMNLKSLPES